MRFIQYKNNILKDTLHVETNNGYFVSLLGICLVLLYLKKRLGQAYCKRKKGVCTIRIRENNRTLSAIINFGPYI